MKAKYQESGKEWGWRGKGKKKKESEYEIVSGSEGGYTYFN